MFATFWKQVLFLTLCALLQKGYGSLECEVTTKPNIIFILVDDLGWNDVSFHGSQQIPTPNIDALARDGVILNQYYVQPMCTPSRAALMTGKYPIKTGLQHFVLWAESPYGLPLNETILPQYLKQLGYATHAIGKWHLGFFQNEYLPVNRGFDSHFGFWSGKEDYFTHWQQSKLFSGLDLHNNFDDEWGYNGTYGTDLFTMKAVDIIENHNASQPLFLYLAHQAVHVANKYEPLQAPAYYFDKFSHIEDLDRRVFAGMMSALDDSIGELFSALDRAKILNNTIIIFSTDNGGEVEGGNHGTGSNYPLRGSKENLWEGGVRGVAFVWSQFLRKVKNVSEELMHITDWLPTLYSLAGGDPSALKDIDGINQWPSICSGESTKRKEILLNIDPEWNVEGIRRGKYKLIKGTVRNGIYDGWYDLEGKKRDNKYFTDEELNIYQQVYKDAALNSAVQDILFMNYGQEYAVKFCSSSSTSNLQEDEADCISCFEYYDDFEEFLGMCACPVTVDCGSRPQNKGVECNPNVAACLFNTDDDPCEYNNLATSEPKIVEELEAALNFYRSEAVPIINKPDDLASNPANRGYAWGPWKS
ncbi:arylsulfatase B-like [Uloborus diversus]|uniref:arylsulfatase B-like n=1 Tax=Uloborus diversus TaxID=327109 RepID=UPI002409164C|nr:arylsulfatase B-like [Uloborus diversus]